MTFQAKKPAVKSAKSTAKRSVKVVWKKVSGADGYQIQYSTKPNFKSKRAVMLKSTKATAKTIRKPKSKKTYYVRMRAYKAIDGKKVFTNYSTKKRVAVKVT